MPSGSEPRNLTNPQTVPAKMSPPPKKQTHGPSIPPLTPQQLDPASPVRQMAFFPIPPPYTFGHNSNTPTKTTYFQLSKSITQPIQLQKTHIHTPLFISYPISTSPLHSFNNNNHNYIPPQQIPPKKSKLHTNIFPFPRSQPQELNNFSLDPT